MSYHLTQYQPLKTDSIPSIIYGARTDRRVAINPDYLVLTMKQLGISDQGVSRATIYVDPKSRLQIFGTHYPNWLGRLRFYFMPEMRQSKGHIIRLSTIMKGSARTDLEMNRTLVHELEHLAQGDRHDKKVIVGHFTIWGLAFAGGLTASMFLRASNMRLAAIIVGAVVGYNVGYIIAAHERQARRRSHQIKSIAVSCD